MKAALLVSSALVGVAHAFYFPGTAPHDYSMNDKVELNVNALTPIVSEGHEKLRSLINYDYYHPQLHFCQPKVIRKQSESLGSILFGDRIFNSPFEIHMLENTGCQTLCSATVPADDAQFINGLIREDYAVNWLIDGLPAAELKQDNQNNTLYDLGFNLGDDEGELRTKDPALNNHYEVSIQYHVSADTKKYRVVGVLVWPMSIMTTDAGKPDCVSRNMPVILLEDRDNKVHFTYRVSWNQSTTRWATRWDNYLKVSQPRIHWISLFNSILIVVFLCVMVNMVLVRTISRDVSRYNAIDLSEDVEVDYGWKLVHGEVFRPPKYPSILAMFVGNGAQLIAMVTVTLGFSLMGFLSPSNRGALATVLMICWTFFAGIGGYMSARVYCALDGENHRRNVFFTATILPTFVFIVMFLLNLLLIGAESSGAVPFGTMIVIVLLWFGISIPLTSVGGYYGRKHGGVYHPVRVNQIPRQVPPAPKYLRTWASSLICGFLPWIAAFMELYFILSSLFASRAYYAWGFVTATAGVVCLTTATCTILLVYFLLCAEEYRWHWRSFLAGGGSALWLLLYSVYYWITWLSLDSASSVLLYFGWVLVLAVFQFLICGTIGFLSSYWAVKRLYSAIRID
ncbi:hypothetical protein BKA62DRAFT_681617 [Auriculariales sp. MPI-PUGE-AT-0066]|nr:hypothetical protein BKA62DRAFT_681617 [Auriculariales sp. MPI-PUGE-AT-0066]